MSQQPHNPYESHLRSLRLQLVLEDADYFHHTTILDVGCADGSLWGELMYDDTKFIVDGVDVDQEMLEQAKETGKYRELHFDISTVDVGSYDHVICLGVLEHVEEYWDFAEVLSEAKYLTLTVPNAWSPHRMLGFHKGMIKNLDDLDESDLSIGHKRVFDPELWQSFLTIFKMHYNFDVLETGSLGFKPLTSGQLSEHTDLFGALDKVGMDLELCGPGTIHGAELYAVLKKKS
jgi:hypothetical protein